MNQLIPGGLLIAVEGIDGAGKTSVATLLAQYCGERGIACVLSKEPTSLKWGRELRRSAQEGRLTLEAELELFRKDREMHVAGTIRPALEQRHVVIVDRYYWSTAAYQGARGADPGQIIADNESFAPRPDVFLLLDLPVAQGLDRIRRRGDEPNDFEKVDSLEKARGIFRDLAAQYPQHSLVIDASASVRDVSRRCLETMQKLAGAKLGVESPHYAQFLGTDR
ncbi:MAG TPA: dTMP kinase [Verrucomicrobiales bacterium]|nr:dTMP kinase [Verrucomicrobiales bacterium]